MAATTILSIHVNKGKTPRQCVSAQLNYIMNPEKTNGGMFISTNACSPETAVEEFLLYRQEYISTTSREIENEILAYHVRQAFKPGEITPEKANEIGKELASQLTNAYQPVFRRSGKAHDSAASAPYSYQGMSFLLPERHVPTG